ncbi:MAG: type I-E CRISPR-associated endoribonuclease Cas2e [Bryobacterales bacterium]|nr:type I-E CRISPR-associated endoribonuclease Cas2e [Bryobacterales bacterium]MEB2363300.1 type I-E CRISPR-associated endoribonuclease Cas2e [Bryobacterales bacterium]
MVVMILERVPISLRGELTRWLLEVRAGVFAGTISARVRDKLWERACGAMGGGAGMLIHNADTEQGFSVRFWGKTGRSVVDYEGLTLIQMPDGP